MWWLTLLLPWMYLKNIARIFGGYFENRLFVFCLCCRKLLNLAFLGVNNLNWPLMSWSISRDISTSLKYNNSFRANAYFYYCLSLVRKIVCILLVLKSYHIQRLYKKLLCNYVCRYSKFNYVRFYIDTTSFVL